MGTSSLSLAASTILVLSATSQPVRADGLDWTLPRLDISGQPSSQTIATVAAVPDLTRCRTLIAAWQTRAEQVAQTSRRGAAQ